jgi:hypothetical protein
MDSPNERWAVYAVRRKPRERLICTELQWRLISVAAKWGIYFLIRDGISSRDEAAWLARDVADDEGAGMAVPAPVMVVRPRLHLWPKSRLAVVG